MNDQKMQITLSKEVMEALREAADKKGVSPNILVRQFLYERFNRSDAEVKTYTFTLKDWREFEGYAEERKLGNVENLALYAMSCYMNKNALTAAQKQRIEERYRKTDPIESGAFPLKAEGV